MTTTKKPNATTATPSTTPLPDCLGGLGSAMAGSTMIDTTMIGSAMMGVSTFWSRAGVIDGMAAFG